VAACRAGVVRAPVAERSLDLLQKVGVNAVEDIADVERDSVFLKLALAVKSREKNLQKVLKDLDNDFLGRELAWFFLHEDPLVLVRPAEAGDKVGHPVIMLASGVLHYFLLAGTKIYINLTHYNFKYK
jgi:hypothetical protein